MVNTSLYVALPIISIFWLLVGGVAPVFVCFLNKGPNKWTIVTMLIITAVCCYTFWLIGFLVQFRPLFGPELDKALAAHMRREWGGMGGFDGKNLTYPCYPAW